MNKNTPYEISVWKDILEPESGEGVFYNTDSLQKISLKRGEEVFPFDPRTTSDFIVEGSSSNASIETKENSKAVITLENKFSYTRPAVLEVELNSGMNNSILNMEVMIESQEENELIEILPNGDGDGFSAFNQVATNLANALSLNEKTKDLLFLTHSIQARGACNLDDAYQFYRADSIHGLDFYVKKIWTYKKNINNLDSTPTFKHGLDTPITFVIGEIYNGPDDINRDYFDDLAETMYDINLTDDDDISYYDVSLVNIVRRSQDMDDGKEALRMVRDVLGAHLAQGRVVNTYFVTISPNQFLGGLHNGRYPYTIYPQTNKIKIHYPCHNLNSKFVIDNELKPEVVKFYRDVVNFDYETHCDTFFANNLKENQNLILPFALKFKSHGDPVTLDDNSYYYKMDEIKRHLIYKKGTSVLTLTEAYDIQQFKYQSVGGKLTETGMLKGNNLAIDRLNVLNYWQTTPKNKIQISIPEGKWKISICFRNRKFFDSDFGKQEYYDYETDKILSCLRRKEYDSVIDKTLKTSMYYGEKKIITIGGNNLKGKNKAVNPILTESLTGVCTLNFSMYTKYFDEKKQKFVKNPFIDFLRNETKIKLKRDDKWYEFLIKDIVEEDEQHMNSYTCKDYSATSLSKQGFNIELSKELYNNQGTIQELAKRVLEESDWTLDEENSDIIFEKQEEALYKVRLYAMTSAYKDEDVAHRAFYNKNGQIYGRIGVNYKTSESTRVGYIEPAATVYMHYSDLKKQWKENELVPCYIHLSDFEKFYDPIPSDGNDILGWDGINTSIENLNKNENGVIDDPNNIVYFKFFGRRDPDVVTDATAGQDPYRGPGSFSTKEFTSNRSKKIVSQVVTQYLPELEKYVEVFKKGEEDYYCYLETEYITPEITSELVVNGGIENKEEGIISDSGWISDDYQVASLNFSSDITKYSDKDFQNQVITNKFLSESTSGYIETILSNDNNSADKTFYICNTGLDANKETIKGFTENDKYILELEASAKSLSGPDFELSQSLIYNFPFLSIVEYTAEGFKCIGDPITEVTGNCRWANQQYASGKTTGFLTFELRVKQSFSEDGLNNKTIALVIPVTVPGQCKGEFNIYGASLYKKIVEDGYIIGPDFILREKTENWGSDLNYEGKPLPSSYYKPETSSITPAATIKENYCLFKKSDYMDLVSSKADFSLKDISFIYKGEVRPDQTKLGYNEVLSNEKIRNIEANKSNIFNILQTLSEVFGCWCKFRVEYAENGMVKRDNINGLIRPRKFISFHENIGNLNPLGIKYNINKKTIQRNINSDSIVTKLIVPDNLTSVGENGFCSISRTDDNISKDNVIYNLNYYIQMNFLDESTQEDIYKYSEDMGKEGKNLPLITEQLNAKDKAKTSLKAEKTVWFERIEETKQKLTNLKQDFVSIYNCDPEKLKASIDNWPSDIYTSEAKDEFINGFREDLTTILKLENELGKDSETNDKGEELKAATGYYLKYNTVFTALRVAEAEYNSYLNEIQLLKTKRSNLTKDFNNKYGIYLQEGTWSSADYLDDNRYYHDAFQTLALSAKPQISYSIEMLDVSFQEGKGLYKYQLGDRTTIEDPEFFGWTLTKIKANGQDFYIQTPYKEMVVFTEIKNVLDDPSQNTITVQNYRTQFEDLFQKMSAETQTLQFKEGSYDNAAGAVGSNGQILPDAITNTFNNTSFIISHALSQGLTWDDRGITVIDQTAKNKVIRIAGGQIWISNNSGLNWTTSIDGNGINANTITTGTLNITTQLNIKSGNNNAFTWNTDGINAYLYDNNQFYVNNKITFNQYGLFGGLATGNNLSDTFMQQLANIHKNSRFALTWKGFSLKTGHANSTGYVSIDSDDDITLNVKPTGSSNYLKIIQIGHLESTASTSASDAGESAEPTSQSSESGHYGIRVKDMTGNVILETTEEHVNGRFHINCGKWS